MRIPPANFGPMNEPSCGRAIGVTSAHDATLLARVSPRAADAVRAGLIFGGTLSGPLGAIANAITALPISVHS